MFRDSECCRKYGTPRIIVSVSVPSPQDPPPGHGKTNRAEPRRTRRVIKADNACNCGRSCRDVMTGVRPNSQWGSSSDPPHDLAVIIMQPQVMCGGRGGTSRATRHILWSLHTPALGKSMAPSPRLPGAGCYWGLCEFRSNTKRTSRIYPCEDAAQ